MITMLFLAFLTAPQVHVAVPSVSVVSQLECGTSHFAVVQVSNRSENESIFFPLSPLYTKGLTIHNVRLEVEHHGRWSLVGRGSDIPGSGVRELRPGGRFMDYFLLPNPDQAVTLKGSPLRLVIPYKVNDSFEQVRTEEFRVSNLVARSDLTCPTTLNASSSAK